MRGTQRGDTTAEPIRESSHCSSRRSATTQTPRTIPSTTSADTWLGAGFLLLRDGGRERMPLRYTDGGQRSLEIEVLLRGRNTNATSVYIPGMTRYTDN